MTVHATAVLIGEGALLIRGPSGSGKSFIALDLLSQAQSQNRYCARLVADDRVLLEKKGESLMATAPRQLAGLIEQRHQGILQKVHEQRALVRAVLDLDENATRLPEADEHFCIIEEIKLPRFIRPPHSPLSLAEALAMTTLYAVNKP